MMWLSNLVFAIAIVTAVLTLLDWLLSKRAKAAINDAMIQVWGWLTYQTSLPYVRVLRMPQAFYVLLLIGTLPPLLFLLWSMRLATVNTSAQAMRDPLVVGIGVLVLAVLVALVGRIRRLFAWVLQGERQVVWIVRSFAVAAGFVAVAAIGSSIAGFSLYSGVTTGNVTADLILWLVLLVLVSLVLSVGFGFAEMFLLILLYSAGIILLMGIFRILELIVARIAEYDRGPMTAAVVALTALGSILRTLGS